MFENFRKPRKLTPPKALSEQRAFDERLALDEENTEQERRMEEMLRKMRGDRPRKSTPQATFVEAERRIKVAWAEEASTLNLSELGLVTLPTSLGKLTQLHELDVTLNSLTTLPECLDHLIRLKWLNASSNQLTALPEALRRLANPEQLFLHGNQALDLPPEMLGPAWQEVSGGHEPADPASILDYYFKTRGNRAESWPLNEAKTLPSG
jgi:hypothetical protein